MGIGCYRRTKKGKSGRALSGAGQVRASSGGNLTRGASSRNRISNDRIDTESCNHRRYQARIRPRRGDQCHPLPKITLGNNSSSSSRTQCTNLGAI